MFEQPDPTLPPVNISQQIAELKRERALRVNVYSREVARGSLKKSAAEYHMHCLDYCIRSLAFLCDNRAVIHAAIAEQKEIERNIAGEDAA